MYLERVRSVMACWTTRSAAIIIVLICSLLRPAIAQPPFQPLFDFDFRGYGSQKTVDSVSGNVATAEGGATRSGTGILLASTTKGEDVVTITGGLGTGTISGDTTIEALVRIVAFPTPVGVASWAYSYIFECGVDTNQDTVALMIKSSDGVTGSVYLRVVDGTLTPTTVTFAVIEATATIELDTWVHIVGTMGVSEVKLYINGEGTAPHASPRAPNDVARPKCWIGNSASTASAAQAFQGEIAFLRIYNGIVASTTITSPPPSGWLHRLHRVTLQHSYDFRSAMTTTEFTDSGFSASSATISRSGGVGAPGLASYSLTEGIILGTNTVSFLDLNGMGNDMGGATTIEILMKTDSTSIVPTPIFSCSNGGSDHQHVQIELKDEGGATFTIRGGIRIDDGGVPAWWYWSTAPTGSITIGNTHHVVLVFNVNSVTIYINGQPFSTAMLSGNALEKVTRDECYLGKGGGSFSFAFMRIYSRAMSGNQVVAAYNDVNLQFSVPFTFGLRYTNQAKTFAVSEQALTIPFVNATKHDAHIMIALRDNANAICAGTFGATWTMVDFYSLTHSDREFFPPIGGVSNDVGAFFLADCNFARWSFASSSAPGNYEYYYFPSPGASLSIL